MLEFFIYILFLSVLLSGIYLTNFIGAIAITKNSGEVLDNLTWTNISSLTDKIDVSSGDIKLDGKLYVTGNICSEVGGVKKCLGEKGTISNPGTSCLSLYNDGERENKNYYIDPDGEGVGNAPFEVYCDMEYDGGGWILVMSSLRRYTTKPNVDFDSSFASLHGKYVGGNNFYLSKYIRAGDIGIGKLRMEYEGKEASIFNLPEEANTLNELFYRPGTSYTGRIPPVSNSTKYPSQTKVSFLPGRPQTKICTDGFAVFGKDDRMLPGNTSGYDIPQLFHSCNRCSTVPSATVSLGYRRRDGIRRNFFINSHYDFSIFGGNVYPANMTDTDIFKLWIK